MGPGAVPEGLEGLSRDRGNKFRGWDFDLTTDKYIHPFEGPVFQKQFYEVFTYGAGGANDKCLHQKSISMGSAVKELMVALASLRK